jgi:hypothetical protein
MLVFQEKRTRITVKERSNMRVRIAFTTWLVVSAACLFGISSAREATQSSEDPATLDEYHLVARGRMSGARGLNPVQVARLDSNGEILIACLEAKTHEQLQTSGIRFCRSQLELLADWGLLEYDRAAKTYRTTIHVYGSRKAASIRHKVEVMVTRLAGEMRADLDALRSHLAGIDRRRSVFSVLYAYVLHSYAMEQFGDEIYRKPQLSSEAPFWNGYAWAIFPARRFPVAVSVMPMEKIRFFRVSSAAVQAPGFRQFIPLVKDIAADHTVDDPELLETFSAFGIFDSEGRLSVPVFEGEWPAKLEDMARKVYWETIELVDSNEMKEILGMDTQAQAAMFIHYEIRYAFLKHVLDRGIIDAPLDFEVPENNGPEDLRHLVFLIKSAPVGR